MRKNILVILITLVLAVGVWVGIKLVFFPSRINIYEDQVLSHKVEIEENQGGPAIQNHPLEISVMRAGEYPGSEPVIEQTLDPGSNYQRYIVSYKSEGLKIYGLLTVPDSGIDSSVSIATDGFPAIIFNHGYIPPTQYRTTEKYVAYVDAFARNGYVVFKSDYRGHGNSEGRPEGAYYSPAYTIDVLNALTAIKKLKKSAFGETDDLVFFEANSERTKMAMNLVDPERIGMWGHSMGGHITLRSMVVSRDIKAGVIWAGVVGSYQDMAENWHRSRPWQASPAETAFRRPNRQMLIDQYGGFDVNPEFWRSISPIAFVSAISGPVQIHHGTADTEVPVLFSERLTDALKVAGQTPELFIYENDDHNLSRNLRLALQRSVEWFDKYVK